MPRKGLAWFGRKLDALDAAGDEEYRILLRSFRKRYWDDTCDTHDDTPIWFYAIGAPWRGTPPLFMSEEENIKLQISDAMDMIQQVEDHHNDRNSFMACPDPLIDLVGGPTRPCFPSWSGPFIWHEKDFHHFLVRFDKLCLFKSSDRDLPSEVNAAIRKRMNLPALK